MLDSGSTPDSVGVSTVSGHLSGSAHWSGDLQTIRSGHPTSSGLPSILTRPNGSTGSKKPGQPTQSSQVSLDSLTTTGSAAVPSPTMTPGVLITEGAGAVLAIIPLTIGMVASLTQAQQAITALSESNSPKADDVKHALEILAATYASLGILGGTIPELDVNSLPQNSKPAIQNIAKTLPQIEQGTKDTITDVMSAVKDPKNVNINDIHKANQLLGKQGSVTQQVTPTFKQLTDWKPPKGIGDITLPGSVTLPSPSLADSWKGTTIPGTLTVASPSAHWDKPPLSSSHSSSSIMDGLKGLGKQAEDAVHAAASSLTHLSGLASASSSDFLGLVGLQTSAAEGKSNFRARCCLH